MKPFGHILADYFLPTRRNHYRPGLFSKNSVTAILALMVFFQVAYFATTFAVRKNPDFLGSVLPGVLTALTNDDRAATGVSQLTIDSLLVKAAQAKADDMAAKGYFSHVTPDGKTPWYWLDEVGYRYTYAGENLAVDFNDSKEVEAAWMKSPAHHANLIKPEFTQIGIAVAEGTYEGKQAMFVVQFFGTPRAAPPPVKKTTIAPTPTLKKAITQSTPTTSGAVLGSAVGSASASSPHPEKEPNVLISAAASPNYTLFALTGFILFLVAVFLFLAIFVKIEIQHFSVVAGGVLMLAVSAGFFFAAQFRISHDYIRLPHDSNAASVYSGFASTP